MSLLAKSNHYSKNCANVEILDIIYNAPFALGSLLKYMTRLGDKDSKDKELEKIADYLKVSCMFSRDYEFNSWWLQNRSKVYFFKDVFESKGFHELNYKDDLDGFLNAVDSSIAKLQSKCDIQ